MKFNNKIIFFIIIASEIFFYCPDLLFSASLEDEIVVVVNLNNPVNSLTPKEVSDLFLSRRRTFPSGEAVILIEQERNSFLREKFFYLINKMTVRRVNAYWARLQFSGEVQPPEYLPNSQAVLEVIRKNTNAIGYVDFANVDDSVRVVLHLKD
ncbi:MAG: hypothetical protein HQK63_02195 [Desulfamplus sp.]|nr:hypothetical protein [Desulfamplus sp.]